MRYTYKKERRDPQIQSYITTQGKKWRIKFSITVRNQKKFIEKNGFRSFDEARVAKQDLLNQVSTNFNNKNITVYEYFNQYCQEKIDNGSWRYTTYKQSTYMFERNVFPTWGKFKLKDVTRLDYQSWITKYAKTKRYSKNYMRLLNGLVAGVFTDAVLNDVISKSPIQKIKVSGSPSRDTSITRSEFNTVFNFIKDSERLTLQQRTMALLTLIGLRHEEIMGIRVKYVKQNMLGIFETINIHGQVSTPKTSSSNRWVPMPPIIEEHLQRCIQQSKVVYASNNLIMSKNDLIFVNHLAKQVRYSELSTIFKIISRETNIHVWPHKMRHAFSTIAFGIPGLNPKDIANILGHSKIDMSLYYNNGTKEGQTDAMEKIISLF